jgi:two-component system sensor histidine kinase UhpB
LLVSLACGSILVGWHAASSVRTELRAALDVGAKSISNGLVDLTAVDDPGTYLRRLVATFNGNRHVRATLLDEQDQPVATSELFDPTEVVPAWFRDLIGSVPGPVRLKVPPAGNGAIVLRADPINEIGEVWDESRDAVLVLGSFALLSALLIYLAVGYALRPLETLSIAFARIGEGDYDGGISESGPLELARLANGFNLMTRQLASMAAQNRRLNERLLTLQAEERADLARDLHDEIGPLLFAVDMTAATIEHLADNKRGAEVPAHARSIHEAVGRMQRNVRAILQRLRPLRANGLAGAIERLAMFWRNRCPNVDFAVTVSVEEDRIEDDMRETIYRVVQEGLSNAIRHGAPARVEINVTHDAADGIRVEVTDNGIGLPATGKIPRGPSQFGLIGMRERVMAMAGSLSIRPANDGKGLALVARLQCEYVPKSCDLDVPE